MQQFWFLIGQTGEHLAHSWLMSKPHSSRTDFIPFGWPDSVVIFWIWLWTARNGLDCGIMVSRCFRCMPLFNLFMSNTRRASGGKDPCAEDWSNTKRAWQLGWTMLNMSMASRTCTRSWSQSHQGSPFEPGWMTFRASQMMFPEPSLSTRRLSSSFSQSEIWINRPRNFFRSSCSPSCNLSQNTKNQPEMQSQYSPSTTWLIMCVKTAFILELGNYSPFSWLQNWIMPFQLGTFISGHLGLVFSHHR